MIFVIYLLIINVSAFILFWIDKSNMKKRKQPVSSARLILLAVLGGSVGTLLGMFVFRHKTKEKKFCYTVSIFTVLWCAVWFFVYIRIIILS